MVGLKVAFYGAYQANQQENRADNDMKPMEPCRHEECRRVDAVGEVKGRVAVFDGLQRGEEGAQSDRRDQPVYRQFLVAAHQRVMRPVDGDAGSEQDNRISQRQFIPDEGFDTLRRPDAARQIVGKLPREQAGIEERPEEGHEEHHFGRYEQEHAVAKAILNDRRVVPLECGFLDHIAPPQNHGRSHQQDAWNDRSNTKGLADAAHHIRVHKEHQPDGQGKARQCAQRGPRARVHQMVIMFNFAAHILFPRLSRTVPLKNRTNFTVPSRRVWPPR